MFVPSCVVPHYACAFTAVFFLTACGQEADTDTLPVVTCPGAGDYEHADTVVDAPGEVDTPAARNDPDKAVNGVVEGALKSGSVDVFSRGFSTDPPNNYLIVEWSGREVIDGDGDDFVVFENAFETAGGVFVDPIVVEVSSDADTWTAFPHDYRAEDENEHVRDPEKWVGFAGVTPVGWRSSECTDPFAPRAGGDRFDLADIDRESFRYLRLTSAPTVVNPDTGELFPRDFLSDGFDLDGVYAATSRAR